MATEQIFLGFKRWIEIYAGDCRKSAEVQVRYLNRKSAKLDMFRNKMFLHMECDKYIKKYELESVDEELGKFWLNFYQNKSLIQVCDDGWTKFTIKGKQKCMKNFGLQHLSNAHQICRSNSAQLPLPGSDQANDDTLIAFKGKVLALLC